MATMPLAESRSVTLDDSGNGAVHFGPQVGAMWQLTTASIYVSSATTPAAAMPSCDLSLGSSGNAGTLIDGTYTGARNSSDLVAGIAVYPGAEIWAVWKGGEPASTATLTVYGQSITGYRGGTA